MSTRVAAVAVLVALGGCSRNPSILFEHAGPHAALTGWLFWIFFIASALTWVAVLAFLGLALQRGRATARAGDAPLRPDAAADRSLAHWVAAAVAGTVAILTVFVGASYAVDRWMIGLDREAKREIIITANQWWWEIKYQDPEPAKQFVTANEIHVPVGEPVRLILRSNDVIHSFWIPNVAGKRDIIPGLDNSLVIRADKEGTWQGRCAEFCGLQHAQMALLLIAQPAKEFEAWRAAQVKPAADPVTDEQKRGKQVFETKGCGMCHIVRGGDTAGYSSNAPELTHLKSRTTIAAGAAPNTRGHLGGWILDPHGIKPGVHMPVNLLDAGDFQALLAYLDSLT
jgi:cytochrome c oxidase subunit 2